MSGVTLVSKSKSKEHHPSNQSTSSAGYSGVQKASKSSSSRLGAFYSAGPVMSLGGPVQAKMKVGRSGDSYEREADSIAERIMSGGRVSLISGISSGGVGSVAQRQEEEEHEEEELIQAKNLSISHPRKTEYSQFVSSPADRTLYLQRTIGDQAVQRLPRSGALQAKLRIGQPGDKYEHEADRVAEAVMRMPQVQRQVEPEDEEEEELQAKSTSGHIFGENPNLKSHIQSLKGGGQPLSENDRAFFEPRFGYDFSRLRIHLKGAVLNLPIQLKLRINEPGNLYEQEADRIADAVMRMRESDSLPSSIHLPLPHLQRQETEEPWYRVYGGKEINKSDDYVVAGISQKIGDVANHRVELVNPGASYTPPDGWDLDCFIRRDGSARKFPGKLAYLGFENEMTAKKVKVNFPQYIKDAVSLFSKNPKPVKSETQILRRAAYSQKPINDIPINKVIHSGAGHPLDNSTRAFMESRFGHDFTKVLVHTDAKAAEAVQVVNARAFTVGRDVVFGTGEYAPHTTTGKRLIAHELTHVVQQSGADRMRGSQGNQIRGLSSIALMCQQEGNASEQQSHGFWGTIGGGLTGEFNEDPNFAMIGVDLGVSLVPVLDQASDVRDIYAHLYFMTVKEQYDRFMRWIGLVFSLIGLFPEIGSAIKGASKFIIKGVREVLTHIEELLLPLRRILPEIADVRRFQAYITRNWSSFVAFGTMAWNKALNRVTRLVNAASTFVGRQKMRIHDALARIREIAPSKLASAFSWGKRQFDNVLNQVRERLGLHEELGPPPAGKPISKELDAAELREVLEHTLPKPGGLRYSVQRLQDVKYLRHNPPHQPANLDNNGRRLYDDYISYYNKRLVDLERQLQSGTMRSEPPRTWESYRTIREGPGGDIARGRAHQSRVTRSMSSHEEFLTMEDVGLSRVSKPKKGEVKFADQLILDSTNHSVTSVSNKSRNLRAKVKDYTKTELDTIRDQARADVKELFEKYSGDLYIRRNGHPLFGKQVSVREVILVYENDVGLINRDLANIMMKAARDQARAINKNIKFHVTAQ